MALSGGFQQVSKMLKNNSSEEIVEVNSSSFIADTFSEGSTRTTIIPTVISMIKDNPWQGYGFGSFDKRYLQYQSSYLNINPEARYEVGLDHPHNEFIMWWIEGGIVSLISLIALCLLVLYYIMRSGVGVGFMKVGVLAPFVVHSSLEFPFLLVFCTPIHIYNTYTLF